MEEENKENLLDKYKIPVLAGLVGLVLLIGGIISSGIIPKTFIKSSKQLPQSTGQASGITKTAEVKVDVSGAVVSPGVYILSVDARVEDAIKAAGGVLNSVNSDYLAKNVNLAQKITDGMKIYVPSEQETASQNILSQSPASSIQNSLINVNTASLADLDKLPGVGAVTAQKIIDNRPYSGIEELLTKKALTRSLYEKIKGMVTTW